MSEKIIYSLVTDNNSSDKVLAEYTTAWGGNYSAFSKNLLTKVKEP
jgi:hypothetical protein